MKPATSLDVEVDGRQLSISNLEKVMYPGTGFTKGEVIDYYTRIAPHMLPHLRGRPLTRVRWPHGTGDKSFFEKNCPPHRPAWVRTASVVHKGEAIEFCLAEDRATLVWLANLAALELHPQLHLASDVERPTVVVFDLDPGPPAALREACDVALWVRDVLEALGLKAWPKVSGGKGLQVYLPLHTPVTYGQTKEFAHGIARVLERENPGAVVSRMPKDLRKGKVFIDWSQNDQVKTTVAVYSLRGGPRPTVSTPVTWAEVEAAVAAEDASGLVFLADAALARVAERGDLFAPVASLRQRLPDLGAGG